MSHKKANNAEAESANPERSEWFENLPRVYVYPYSQNRKWASPQCSACFEIMRPTDDVHAWMKEHFAHRNENLYKGYGRRS